MKDPLPDSRVPASKIKSYYGDSDVRSGVIKLLKGTTFQEFHQHHFVRPVMVPRTRAEFDLIGHPPRTEDQDDDAYSKALAVGKREQGKIKFAPYYIAGTAVGPCERSGAPLIGCSLITIDIDNSTDAAPLVTSKGQLVAQTIPWNFILHHTLSSTPHMPRVRLVIDADLFPEESYLQAVAYICDRLGVTPDPACRNPRQPMYVPTTCSDDPLPIIASRLVGPAIPKSAFENHPLSENDLGTFTGNATSFSPPLRGVSDEMVKSLLECLEDPDESYDLWINMLMALQHQFGQGTAEEEEKGFDFFNEWSQRGAKYDGHDVTYRKWRSFKASPDKIRPTTLATIMMTAKQRGWSHHAAEEDMHADLVAMIEAETSPEALTTTCLKAIAENTALGDLQTQILLTQIHEKLKKTASKVNMPSLRREVHRMRKAKDREIKETNETTPSWMEGWVFLADSNVFVHAHNGQVLPRQGFDGFFTNEVIADDASRPPFPSTVALLHPSFQRAMATEYNPSRPGDLFYTENGRDLMNSYRADYIEADESRSEEAGMILRRHTAMLFPDPRHQDILLSFFAYLVQKPGAKIRWCVFMQGAPGCGKSIYADMMAGVLGPSNVNIIDQNKLNSSYTDWYQSSQLLAFDEIVVGEHRKDLMERLKTLITNETLALTQKYKPSSTVRNYTNSMFTSNHRNGIHIDDTDRRYFVLCTAQQKKEDVKAINPEWFSDFGRLGRDLAGGARHFLANFKLHPEFEPDRGAPETVYRDTVIGTSESELTFAIKEAITQHVHPMITEDIINSVQLGVELRGTRGASAKGISVALDKLNYEKMGNPMIDGVHRWPVWVHRESDAYIIGDWLEEYKARVEKAKTGDFKELT